MNIYELYTSNLKVWLCVVSSQCVLEAVCLSGVIYPTRPRAWHAKCKTVVTNL